MTTPVDFKKCPRCEIEKPLSDYYVGNLSYCKPCKGEYDRERRQTQGSAVSSAGVRASRWRSYGATDEQVLTLQYLYVNGTECDICGTEILEESMYVDHDHTDSVIRGVLCGTCNSGLGMFKDNVRSLATAIDYLNRSRLQYHIKVTKAA